MYYQRLLEAKVVQFINGCARVSIQQRINLDIKNIFSELGWMFRVVTFSTTGQ